MEGQFSHLDATGRLRMVDVTAKRMTRRVATARCVVITSADIAALETMGEQAWRLHDQPAAGIWELRTRARIHTSSSLMCWAACDRLAHIATRVALPERARFWRERADIIRGKISVADYMADNACRY